MEHDIENICRELLDRSRSFRPGPESKVGPGVYALLLDAHDLAALGPLTIAEGGLFYVGMTADKAGERNHFALEHSGFSSPRRSLGALLKDKLSLRACRRAPGPSDSNWEHYRFSDAGENALTQWMNDRLSMNHVPLSGDKDDIKEVEKQVIARLRPPMNLDKWRNPQKTMVMELRTICREEARAGKP
jgi:hypothetical protein